MDLKLIIQIQTLYIFPIALSQQEFEQYYYTDERNGYQTGEYPEYEQEQLKDMKHHKTFSEDYKEYVDDLNECSCLCQTCVDIQPCCKSVCVNCVTSQSSVMLVPYVYPIILTKNQKDASDKNEMVAIISTTVTTTMSTTTTTAKVETTTEKFTTKANALDDTIIRNPEKLHTETKTVDIPKTTITDMGKGPYQFSDKKDNFVMTSLRRTKTNWLPKYGIVPIPDQLAEKILLQLRDIKVLHPNHKSMRTMDFLK